MNDLRTAAQQALEALGHVVRQAQENLVPTIHYGPVHDVMNNLRAALAQQAEPTGKKSLQVEPTVAENATTQQQIEQTPPSDYRRGYWAGFAIGKREGRIEAEDELAKQAEPVEPVAEARYDGTLRWLEPHGVGLHRIQGPLYTAPPQQAEPVEPVAWVHNILEDNIIRHRPADLKRSPQNWTPLCNCAQPRQSDPQIEDRLARHGIPKP